MPPEKKKNKVELRQAFAFDCDACGRENFVRARAAELSPEDREEMRRELEMDDEEFRSLGLVLTMRPKAVECGECGAKFEVENDEDEPGQVNKGDGDTDYDPEEFDGDAGWR